jgi:diguanylate cyclase (GGDEF)-like protein
VVLVGRTGMEQELRRDPGVELGRARTALDAIGELADMSEPGDTRPTTVVVGPGVLTPEISGAFVESLRRIDAGVRVVAMGHVDSAPGIFDAALPATADAGTLRRALHAAAASVAVAPAIPHDEPGTSHIPTPLGAMLVGKDPIAAAVDEMSARLGTACVFTPGAQPSAPDEGESVRVAHAGRTLGWLRAAGIDRSIVEREAATLAGWVMLAAQQDQLRRAAFTDELTGAFNRRYFNRFLAAALEQARSRRHPVALLVFDIDNFKTYNDRYSHSAGDEILSETVRLLTSVIRPTDRVCRVGGDEFAVIFHDPEGPRNPEAAPTPQTIAQIAARFQKQICEHRFPKLLHEASGTLTISGGMATFPWDGATPEALLARADELAMQSKRQGKNSITFGPGAARVCQIGEAGGGVEA